MVLRSIFSRPAVKELFVFALVLPVNLDVDEAASAGARSDPPTLGGLKCSVREDLESELLGADVELTEVVQDELNESALDDCIPSTSRSSRD